MTSLLALVAVAFFTFDVDAERAFARRALAAARPLGDPVLIGAAASAVAQAAANAGAMAETRSSLDEAAAHLDAVPDGAIAGQLDAINRLAWSEFLIERYDDAIRHAARGVAVARSTGQEQFGPLIVGAQALSSARRGDLAAAAALQEEALETAEVAANAYVMCWVLTISAHVAMETGDLDDARRAAGRAVDLMSGLGDSRVAAMARVRLAATRREMGDPAVGTETLVREAGGWELTRIQPGWRVAYAEAMTRVELGARARRGRRAVRRLRRTRRGGARPPGGDGDREACQGGRTARHRRGRAGDRPGAGVRRRGERRRRADRSGPVTRARRPGARHGRRPHEGRAPPPLSGEDIRRMRRPTRPRRGSARAAATRSESRSRAGRRREPTADSIRSRGASSRSPSSSPPARRIGRWRRSSS